ncbi:glycosyltransferase [Oryzicola mucosus]|uniref:Glycosyltransferase n=1 Tax=Oryzicola mucosus TaxID=2767425 RepID=A0A8J6PLT2_9HYPH|nr:glycosyltransferase [Oryzicola mucosus]MBD0413475.1 glycosyltransferase [Oryzicola mucosus]
MWIIAALVEDYDVTVYTRSGFDLDALNALAGTRVEPTDITLRMARVETIIPVGAIAAGNFVRSLANVGADYSLRVSASGALPWGRPALHFLSSLDWSPDVRAQLPYGDAVPLRTRVSRVVAALVSGRPRRNAGDIFIANSNWLLRRSKMSRQGDMRVIHPVVPTIPVGLAWSERENIVLVFGRISPEKEIEACIRIVGAARASGFPGRLVIAGPHGEDGYVRRIRALVAEHDWIEMLPAVVSREKEKLLGRVKYGLNACRIEAFGISTAEMAAAGAIVLAPADTGQEEIVTDQAQIYRTEVEAAQLLVALERDVEWQVRAVACSADVRERFNPSQFTDAVRATARELVERKR